ncbi:hypothetical protein [Dyadobacter sp. NIV53]|uniref:hypothetical protein n=1 Tax=Dyadobacter sp. NIV53 TaxID=2861765 RepID=UPI001C882D25|nr:hypothetical protein [Dyadobacter sp. NIV53]
MENVSCSTIHARILEEFNGQLKRTSQYMLQLSQASEIANQEISEPACLKPAYELRTSALQAPSSMIQIHYLFSFF